MLIALQMFQKSSRKKSHTFPQWLLVFNNNSDLSYKNRG
jgi:hypothetical protein